MKTIKSLQSLNIFISLAIFILAVFIVLIPSIPEIVLALSDNKYEGYTYNSVKTLSVIGDKSNELPLIPSENRLVIPKIYVNAPISEGEDSSSLDHGMWRRPNTSTPDKGGNTVITGHRRLFSSGPNTFYHLDKLKVNDTILVYYKGKEYVYIIYEINVVNPDQIEIENNTKDSIVTLYTCTPLWTSEKRLVVKAILQ